MLNHLADRAEARDAVAAQVNPDAPSSVETAPKKPEDATSPPEPSMPPTPLVVRTDYVPQPSDPSLN